jgi:uncharacterized PurR-regulated membrane protein YhhQ (DUF165 family)
MTALREEALVLGLWILYLSTIVLANVAIQTFGLVPVGFGLVAPAAVYVAGFAFTFRDLLQDAGGRGFVLLAIVAGAALSALVDPLLGLASGVAFLFSELADLAVYTPLRRRGWLRAVFASNVVGLVLDSILFLSIAFGSLELLSGQIVGKLWTTLAAIAVLAGIRYVQARRARARELQAAG